MDIHVCCPCYAQAVIQAQHMCLALAPSAAVSLYDFRSNKGQIVS